jgi:hypothetical protein
MELSLERGARLASHPVARAVLLSILLHLTLFLLIETGNRMGWWSVQMLPESLRPSDRTSAALSEAARREQEIPLIFMEVDPEQAAPEPPKDALYYSDRRSVAANPEPGSAAVPKISGTQDLVPRTMDTARVEAPPVEAAPAPEPPAALQPAEQRPAEALQPARPVETATVPLAESPAELAPPGTLELAEAAQKPPAMREPALAPERIETPAPRVRPRTLAAAQQQRGVVPGERMMQDGGVSRTAPRSTMDVRVTGFGAYDAAFVSAVSKRWHDLLDQRSFTGNYKGKVVLGFRLNADGRVTEMKVRENDVSEVLALICQRAVQDPAPYAKWPSDMRRMIGNDYRDVTFTFYYR